MLYVLGVFGATALGTAIGVAIAMFGTAELERRRLRGIWGRKSPFLESFENRNGVWYRRRHEVKR